MKANLSEIPDSDYLREIMKPAAGFTVWLRSHRSYPAVYADFDVPVGQSLPCGHIPSLGRSTRLRVLHYSAEHGAFTALQHLGCASNLILLLPARYHEELAMQQLPIQRAPQHAKPSEANSGLRSGVYGAVRTQGSPSQKVDFD
ncbi:MAG: hypothetical protein JWO40_837 [Candidatus Doudnabacteria bacterium]|nr:hypothetical protein [Candidatus Doudnabacteria bacterium]